MNKNIALEENFISTLMNLSDDMKIRIINRLSSSMIKKHTKQSIESMFGVWKDNGMSAEEMINAIKDNRGADKREIVSLDD